MHASSSGATMVERSSRSMAIPVQLPYVSPTQIYAQLPFSVDGYIMIRVTTPNGFVEQVHLTWLRLGF